MTTLTNAGIPRGSTEGANPLRVVWLSPLMRPLARVQAEALRARGMDVLLVTTDRHPESDARRDYEMVLDLSFRTASTWLAAWRRIREHRPDVVIAERVRDPRWIALAGRTPRIQLVHDERRDEGGRWRRAFARAMFDRWASRSAATVTYSNYAAIAVAIRRDVAGTPVNVLPLCSDLDPALVPPFVGPDERHDFVVAGQLGSQKNIDVVLEAWQRHVDGGSWRGDELLLIGNGPLVIRTLPAYVRWRPGNYRYADVVSTMAAAKGSVAHYRGASQSGVQMLSMHLGVMPIVSPVGGLPEYQPAVFPPIAVDNVAGLTAAFDELSDPLTATLRGAAAARHYADWFAVDHAVDGLWNVLTAVGHRIGKASV
ncbi:MAG TPA: glycosyltransferase [Acidothermaceae bacterium]|nr:glycosyltransferase [Acidothermaceae bacterium]